MSWPEGGAGRAVRFPCRELHERCFVTTLTAREGPPDAGGPSLLVAPRPTQDRMNRQHAARTLGQTQDGMFHHCLVMTK